jgi:hypothetical protein
MSDNQITIEEVNNLARFIPSELQKFTRAISMLITNKGTFDNNLNKDIINNSSEIITYLPQITHFYLQTSEKEFQNILHLMIAFSQHYPNHSFTQTFLNTINVIHRYFVRFGKSEELSLAAPSQGNSNEGLPDKNELQQKVINPYTHDNTKEFNKTVKGMVKSSGSRYVSDDNWKTLANNVKSIQEGPVGPDPYVEATSELLLSAVNRLKTRETEFNKRKQTLSQLSNATMEPMDQRSRRKKRINDLLSTASNGILDTSNKAD